MKRISSSETFFWKYLLPIVLLFMPAFLLLTIDAPFTSNLLFTLLLCSGLSLGTWFFRRTFLGRLKYVSIDKKQLCASNYWTEVCVPLSAIDYTQKRDVGRFEVVTIYLKVDTEFGQEIMFMPISGHTLPEKGTARDLLKKIPPL